MSILREKKIVLGITGGIAAYKIPSLVRLFIKAGAQVKVIITPAAKEFVTPLTLATLSKNPVYSHFVDDDQSGVWNSHVDFGLWADLILIAPATANTMSKMASGSSDNLLLATYLSAKCPVYFAPAMDLDMFQHETTKASLATLASFGNIMIPAASGELASGLVGEGRMAEPEDIVEFIQKDVLKALPLFGKKVLITAGPTYEAIDPVRFVGNHSSGKMGFELAKVAAQFGAEVLLVAGPTHQIAQNSFIKTISVTSAQQMYDAVHKIFSSVDIAIFSAAVSDYKPKKSSTQKIKKTDKTFVLELEKTKDILESCGKIKTHQLLVGFALETNNELTHAKNKLKKKNLDLIVLNSLNDDGAGFGSDTNKVTIINKLEEIKPFELKPKNEVALDIFNEILNLFNA